MLKTLTVWNFALIEYVQIEFSEGLNILTGETGAGKSILIGSVGVILGSRVTVDNIRNDSDWLRVEAVFDIAGQAALRRFLEENGIVEEEGELIISRQISRAGRNVIRVNGCQVTLTLLREMARLLIDLHGQHENQALLRTENQFALLDGTDAALAKILEEYKEKFNAWNGLNQKLRQSEQDSRTYAQRLDMLRWQTDEIEAAKLAAGEEEKLEAEYKVLANAEKIAVAMQQAHGLLENGGKGSDGILASLAEVKKNIETAARYDEALGAVLTMLDESICQLQECSYEIREYGGDVDYSPQRLDALQERLDAIYKLRKKYGATVEDVLAHYRQAKQELADIENYDERIASLKKEIQRAKEALDEAAARLTAARQGAAAKLSEEVCAHLHFLGMPDAQFFIAVSPSEKMTGNGADSIQMMFSGNLGETPRLMQKVASGGELSRIALAIKAVGASRDAAGVMIFDEIDTGIGGRTAQMVAERIAMVAAHKQVLCITHLPQIACMADAHLYIDKQVAANQTVTKVRRLSATEQLHELARMFSGMDVTASSLENAQEMCQNAQMKKMKWRRECGKRN